MVKAVVFILLAIQHFSKAQKKNLGRQPRRSMDAIHIITYHPTNLTTCKYPFGVLPLVTSWNYF